VNNIEEPEYSLELRKLREDLEAVTDQKLVDVLSTAPHLPGNAHLAMYSSYSLSLLVEECGKRRLREAAPFIVRFVTWDLVSEFCSGISGASVKALERIGDFSVVPLFQKLVGERLDNYICWSEYYLISWLSDLLAVHLLPGELFQVPPKIITKETLPLSAAFVMEAYERAFRFRTKEAVMSWADLMIEQLDEPPLWLVDLAMTVIPEREGISNYIRLLSSRSCQLTDRQRVMLQVTSFQRGFLSLNETIYRIYVLFRRDRDLDLDIGPWQPDAVTEQLVAELDDWFFGGSAERWTSQESIDKAVKEKVEALRPLFNELLKDAGEAVCVLDALNLGDRLEN